MAGWLSWLGFGSKRGVTPSPVVRIEPSMGAVSRSRAALSSDYARQTRSIKAAMQSRLTSDWEVGGGDINQEIRNSISTLRNRARNQELNNNFVRRFLRMCEIHIVGPHGFKLQVRGKLARGKGDTVNNNRLEAIISDWCKAGACEITGRLSFTELQRLVVRSVARDGESLVRLWDVQPTPANPIGLVLEVLDAARLDHTLHLDLRDGNRVRMGVEINNAGKPVAYWLLTNLTGESVYQTQQKRHERVPVATLLHIFHAERAEQLRGLTWMTAPMLKLHQLDAYSDAAITAARVGASKMGFFESGVDGLGAHAVADEQTTDGDFLTSAEPGEFGILPKGWKFNPFNPDYPSNNYDPFTKTALREASAGFDVSYHGLTGDLREVNFSSIRAGTLEEREHWMTKQAWFIDVLMSRIYQHLLANIALYGLLSMEPSTVLERFRAHTWQPRRWPWVDPLKDIKAAQEAIATGLKSPQMVAAEQGVDVEEVLEQTAQFQQMVKDKGVVLGSQPQPVIDQQQGGANGSTEND